MHHFRTDRRRMDRTGTFLLVTSLALAISMGAGLALFAGIILAIE